MPAPASRKPTATAAAKLGLGTAQFGSDYGVSNARGRIPGAEAALDALTQMIEDRFDEER